MIVPYSCVFRFRKQYRNGIFYFDSSHFIMILAISLYINQVVKNLNVFEIYYIKMLYLLMLNVF